jgi:multiple sugar transport system permease protein
MDKIKSRLAPVLWYAAVLSGLLIVLLPFAWAIASSLRPLSDVFRYTTPFSLRALVPIPFTLEAYANIFQKGFGRALLNTVFVCAATILGGLLLNSLAGFVFSKLRFPGKSIVFTIVLVTFMIPFEVIAIPLYMVARNLGILNTYAALILPGIANGLAIFLFKQFFDEIPSDLIDAARVDGASLFYVYGRIFVPLSKPAMITAGLILFLFQWNAFLWPLISVSSPAHRLVQVAMAYFHTENQVLWNEQFAATVIVALVPIMIILPLQRYFVQGIAGSGIKG